MGCVHYVYYMYFINKKKNIYIYIMLSRWYIVSRCVIESVYCSVMSVDGT